MNETRYIIAGSLIDGLGGSAHKRALLTVRDGRIAAIGSATDCPRGDGAQDVAARRLHGGDARRAGAGIRPGTLLVG